jgi:CheY-like chemotaxis protein
MRAKPKNFLLVDDDPDDRFLLAREFKRHRVHGQLKAVSDGVEAVDYLEGSGEHADRGAYPLPDIILLDLKMPRMNGFEFLEWLRSQAPRELRFLPVVVMSCSILSEDIKRAYALGANSYVTKAQDLQGLRQSIETLNAHWTRVEAPPPAS